MASKNIDAQSSAGAEPPTGTLIHVDHGERTTWHHSVEFNGYNHGTACGQVVDCEEFDELRMDVTEWTELDSSGCCDECAGSVRSFLPELSDGGQSVACTDRMEPCQKCGKPVDPTEPGHWKAANDVQWWHEDCFDKTEQWTNSAEGNVNRWGNQTPTVLLLALCEEIAEVADEILATAEKSYEADMVSERAFTHLSEVREAGFQCRTLLETFYEDGNGDPIPNDEMPQLVHDLDEKRVMDELDDAAPLVYQLAWALEDRPIDSDTERSGGDVDGN